MKNIARQRTFASRGLVGIQPFSRPSLYDHRGALGLFVVLLDPTFQVQKNQCCQSSSFFGSCHKCCITYVKGIHTRHGKVHQIGLHRWCVLLPFVPQGATRRRVSVICRIKHQATCIPEVCLTLRAYCWSTNHQRSQSLNPTDHSPAVVTPNVPRAPTTVGLNVVQAEVPYGAASRAPDPSKAK
jgi:hypothetical protein